MTGRHWTRDDDKRFEEALVLFSDTQPNRWEIIAEHLQIPLNEVIYYYDALEHDVELIELGLASMPNYPDCSSPGQISYESENERKKAKPWTHDEHRLFLKGLELYSEGSWKEIARHCVKSRTAKQVASHAQKYFLRQKSKIKSRKRSSIHDITSVDAEEMLQHP